MQRRMIRFPGQSESTAATLFEMSSRLDYVGSLQDADTFLESPFVTLRLAADSVWGITNTDAHGAANDVHTAILVSKTQQLGYLEYVKLLIGLVMHLAT